MVVSQPRMHDDEVETNDELVRCLFASQLPQCVRADTGILGRMKLGRAARLGTSVTFAVAFGACTHSTAIRPPLAPLAPASASIVQVESRQQVIHGRQCPPTFLPSELPGDWCYGIGEVILRPADVVEKSVLLDRDLVRWVINISLRPVAAKHFVAFSNAHAGQDSAIVVGASVVARLPVSAVDGAGFPVHDWTLDGRWTEQQARRIERSLGGTDITSTLVTLPPPVTQG